MHRAAGENAVFLGPISEWTANQRRLVQITKEYTAVFSLVQSRGHDLPSDKVLADYRMFREWCQIYRDDPTIGENPYKKSNHGVSVKR